MRIAVVQHRIRTHERMDLAALLSLSEEAAEQGAQAIVYPCVPGLSASVTLLPAFVVNVLERAPGITMIAPCVAPRRVGPPKPVPTTLGSTLVLAGDECIDTGLYAEVESMGLDALVWQMDAESSLQAEALLELALDASLSQAGLVLIAATVGRARGVEGFGGSAVVHLGEIIAEAGDDEQLLIADVGVPVALPARRAPRAVPAPILQQRLAVHRGVRASRDHLSEGR
jgi:hypothetical protein